LCGEVAVIDLDAAKSKGSNEETIRDLLKVARCRVGGGIRDVETAIKWLDAGAEKVILGTAARAEILRELPRERVIAALDARDGEVVVEGWTKGTGRNVLERIDELKEYAGGFLVTFVELEGRMKGLPLERIEEIVRRAAPARVTVAGGVRDEKDITEADRLGADAQVGMALYTGQLGLAEALCAPLKSDRPDGLWPTVVTDENGHSLGLAYSDLDSVRRALEIRRGVYFSRSRQGVWIKGDTSGDTQDLLAIRVDCDRDTLQFIVRQKGRGFCHTGARTCFGESRTLADLARRLAGIAKDPAHGSYTARLLSEEGLLASKLSEEARELGEATSRDDVEWEASDLIYFTLVAMTRAGVSLEDVERHLARRALKVSRRPGDAKPAPDPQKAETP
jgi:phosphoribosyl-ATP pyrophosphohydrolase